jgi:hypothetical protein
MQEALLHECVLEGEWGALLVGRVVDKALLRVEGTVKTFQQLVDRVGEIPQLAAEGESLVAVAGGDPL